MIKLSVTNRFRVGMAGVLLLFSIGFAVLEYNSLKTMVEETIYKETEIFVTTVEATRTYVKDVTRPKIRKILPPEGFIPEVMSTSYVGREIMGRVRGQFPHFFYKRAARSPMNPVNQADEFELQMLDWFENHRNDRQWSGIVDKANRSYFARLKAIYAETECLACHGEPKDAPRDMKAIYGDDGGGFGYRVGDVVAADTIYIPVDVAFSRIKQKAFWVFMIGIGSLFLLFGLFYLLFNRIILSQLQGLVGKFRTISGMETNGDSPASSFAGHEIEQLKLALEDSAVALQQAHDELKASESKYRRLFETSQDPIFICDGDQRLIDINGAGVRLFGFRHHGDALSIESFYQLFWDGRDAVSLWERIHLAGSIKDSEVEMVDAGGNRIEALITANVRLDEEGRPAGLEGIIRDVTEKKRIEKSLARTETLASLGQLAAGVAHEINNPLGVIQCYTDLIRKYAGSDRQIGEDLNIIEKHTRNCKEVVEALLNFARMSEPQMVNGNIHDCIEEVLTVLDRHLQKHDITVERRYDQGIAPVVFDDSKMKQVFMNLLINAQQSISAAGGRIVVETFGNAPAGTVAVRITDNGCGIARKNQEKIFEPFFTTKDDNDGTGLGLAITYGIVEQHGGTIAVESASGKGSTFIITLPDANTRTQTEEPL